MSLPDELVRLIKETVRNEVKNSFMLNVGGIAGRGGDTVIASMGDVLIRTMGTHKAYYNGTEIGTSGSGVTSFAARTGAVSPIVGDYEAYFLKLTGGSLTGGIDFQVGTGSAIDLNFGVIEGFTENRDWDTGVLPGYGLCKSDLVGTQGIFGGLKTLTVNSTLDFTTGKIILPNSVTVPANCVEGQIYWESDANTLWLGIATNTWDSVLRGAGSSGFISKYSSAGVLGTSSLKEITSDIVFAKHLKSNAKKIYLFDGDPEGAGTARLTLGYTGNDGELIGTNGNLKIKASTNVIMDGNKLVFQVNQTGTATSITDDATGVLVLNTVGKLKVVVT